MNTNRQLKQQAIKQSLSKRRVRMSFRNESKLKSFQERYNRIEMKNKMKKLSKHNT